MTEQLNFLGYTATAQETAVADALVEIGAEGYVPKQVHMVSRGKKRRPKAEEWPILPRMVCIRATAEQYHQFATIRDLRHVSDSFSDRIWRQEVEPFLERCEDECNAVRSRLAAGEKIEAFAPMEPIEIKSGPFAGLVARFRETVERQHDAFPRVRAEVDMLGGTITAEFDPLDVASAQDG